MSKNEYIIDGKTFTSIQKAESYVKEEMLSKVGYTDSVKRDNPEIYKKLESLLQCHPNKTTKQVDKMIDIQIYQNENSAGFNLKIKISNGSFNTIGWRTCIKGKSATNEERLFSALRQAVDYQKHEFKRNSTTKVCDICSCSIDISNKEHVHADRATMSISRS